MAPLGVEAKEPRLDEGIQCLARSQDRTGRISQVLTDQ